MLEYNYHPPLHPITTKSNETWSLIYLNLFAIIGLQSADCPLWMVFLFKPNKAMS